MTVAEMYTNSLYSYQPTIQVARWWVPDYPILIGGSLIDAADFEHLRQAFKVASVVNVETEHDDTGKVPPELLHQARVEDNGDPFARETVLGVVRFVSERRDLGAVYIHCQMGGSRSPGFAYAALRGVWGLAPDAALAKLNEGFAAKQAARGNPSTPVAEVPDGLYGWHPTHQSYIASVEAALL